jgi:endonuclease/exonuclease/phosphatase family metal-dependent hydrolase
MTINTIANLGAKIRFNQPSMENGSTVAAQALGEVLARIIQSCCRVALMDKPAGATTLIGATFPSTANGMDLEFGRGINPTTQATGVKALQVRVADTSQAGIGSTCCAGMMRAADKVVVTGYRPAIAGAAAPGVALTAGAVAAWDKPFGRYEGGGHTLYKSPSPSPAPLAIRNPHGESISVSTFNTRYDQGRAAVDTVKNLAKTKDIILLQEVKGTTLEHVTAGIFDTHEPYLGQGNEKGNNGEFSPVYFNRKKFDAVHMEHMQLNEKGDSGAGSAREANFVLLKDKQTGATTLVVNTHLDNFSAASRQEGIDKIDKKVAEIKSTYPVDSVMVGGDFNENPNNFKSKTGLNGANYEHGMGTFKNGAILDGILVSQPNTGTIASDSYTVTDGGASDHHIVSRDISVTAHADARKADLKPSNFGALLWDKAGFTGDAWITGFGTAGPTDQKWNDRITSIKTSDETVLTAHKDSTRDAAYNDSSNTKTVLAGDVANVGANINDSFSEIQVGPR